MANFFTSKGNGQKQTNNSNAISYYLADVNELNGLVIGTDIAANAKVFDPRTGKVWTLAGSGTITSAAGLITAGGTETTESLPAGTTDNAILKYDSATSTWVEETDFTVTDAGLATAAAGLVATTGGVTASAGNVVATLGNITATAGSVSAGTTVTAGTGVTATTGNIAASSGNVSASGTVTGGTGVTATTGNIAASSGNVSASGTVTGGTGVTATTGGLTATAGGLTVTAGTTDINDTTNISGAVTLDNAGANSLTMAGTTNTVSLNGSGATALTLGGTTSTITLSGSGTKSVTGLSTPSNSTDAANKAYVDSLAAGLDPKESVLLATAAAASATYFIMSNTVGAGNGVILTVTGGSGTFDPDAGETIVTSGGTGTIVAVDHATAGTTTKIYIGGITGSALTTSFTSHSGGVTGLTISSIDTTSVVAFMAYNAVGVAQVDTTSVALNNRILYKDQAVTDNNGIYNVKVIGSATLTQVVARASDQDGTPTNEISTGNFTFVTGGATNVGKGFVLSSTDAADPDNINVHTDSKVFAQFSSAGGGVTSIPTESGTATPSAGVITITGSPSINTSASGSTVTVALAADLDTGATGFTVTNRRVPFASATNTLGDSSALVFDDTNDVLGIGTGSLGGVVLGVSTAGVYVTQGIDAPFNGTVLATDTNSAGNYFSSGNVSGTGASGTASVKSGNSASGATGTAVISSGAVSTSGNSGLVQVSSGNSTTLGNTGNVSIFSGNATSGNSGNIAIATGSASGTRGTITLNADANDTKLTNSPTTDTVTGTNLPNVADVSFIREKVVLRKTGTTTVTLISGASAAKYMIYVQESTTIKYASEFMITSTNATTGVDYNEYAVTGTATIPAGLTITPAASAGVVELTVAQTGGTIIVEAIPLV